MDDNKNPEAPSIKQQLVETLRGAESVVITTQDKPGKDAIAAAIGLHLLLEKLEKVAEVVIASDIPSQLQFLPGDFINKELQGQRDFVIELDQSRAEADSLKYVNENNTLKVYITPYNGTFSGDDVSFSYGDYHCDAIIGLGAHDVSDLTDSVTGEQELIRNASFLLINPGPGGQGSENTLNWNDPNAGSICEMVMSMSEALGSGMLDEDIATALMTGIVERTEHFTNQTTTPKVMTMSAQLLAAGARQSQIVQQLSKPDQPAKEAHGDASGETAHEQGSPQSPDANRPPNEFQLRQAKQGQSDAPNGEQSGGDNSSEVSVRGGDGGASGSSHSQQAGAGTAAGASGATGEQSQSNTGQAHQSASPYAAAGGGQSAADASPQPQSSQSSRPAANQSEGQESSVQPQTQAQAQAGSSSSGGQAGQSASSQQDSTQGQQSPSNQQYPPSAQSGQQAAGNQQTTGASQTSAGQTESGQSQSAAGGNDQTEGVRDPQSQGASIHPPSGSSNSSSNQDAIMAAMNAGGQSNAQQGSGSQTSQQSEQSSAQSTNGQQAAGQQAASSQQSSQHAAAPQQGAAASQGQQASGGQSQQQPSTQQNTSPQAHNSPSTGQQQSAAEQAQASQSQSQQQSSGQQSGQSGQQSGDASSGSDLEAARKAVEEAQKQAGQQADQSQDQSQQNG